ncbi:MAG TPA: carboxylesterase family protein [Draconibacterium sp.]|nr:carboxylesterase family protein [Draconibacterium sp.]
MKKHVFSMVIVVLMTTFSYAQNPGPIEAGDNIAVVATKYGKVRGYIDDGVFAFKGIPYAKADRYMPPKPPDTWDDVLQCTIFGPKAMQSSSTEWRGRSDENFGFQFPRETMDEKESFVLNVWSNGINDDKKRAVWVWIHGGGFRDGSGNQLHFFDGRSLANKGDIIVVTLNHRLNVLGYIDLRELGGKYSESVNLGQQDLVAALQWIQDNIANFGGDPNSVTIAGQSGGGRKVSTLLAMPSAADLFHRVIIQSGSELRIGEDEVSRAFGLEFIKVLGITPDEADKLDDFSYDELLAAGQQTTANMEAAGANLYTMGISPTVDGKYVVQHPFDPEPAEFSKQKPMIIGSNLNEWTFRNEQLVTPKSMEEVRSTLASRYGEKNVDKYIELHRSVYPNHDQPHDLLSLDFRYRSNVIKQATLKSNQGGAPVYTYHFTWQSPVNNGSLGAAHGMELAFAFNNIAMARTLTGGAKDAYNLADKISSAWINFIKTGNPNCKELPKWAPYTPGKGATMIFDNKCKLLNNHDKKLIDFVNSL